jgi:hypothetical protein
MKLNPEDLVVSSFDTTAADRLVISRPTTDPWDPTPMTHCFVCPVDTENCW